MSRRYSEIAAYTREDGLIDDAATALMLLHDMDLLFDELLRDSETLASTVLAVLRPRLTVLSEVGPLRVAVAPHKGMPRARAFVHYRVGNDGGIQVGAFLERFGGSAHGLLVRSDR